MTSSAFKNVSRFTRALVTASLALLACGCSSFNREWRSAGRADVTPDSIVGRWEGHWLSDVNRHNGNLRCLITHQTNDIYAARFRASYLAILRFTYTVSLQVEPLENGWRFNGKEDLGSLAGGVYDYKGSATQTNFHSTYRSPSDHGIFEMNRVAREK